MVKITVVAGNVVVRGDVVVVLIADNVVTGLDFVVLSGASVTGLYGPSGISGNPQNSQK